MSRWTTLRKGDIVDIVAPASHTSRENLELGAEWLESEGLVPRMRERIIEGDVFFAAPLEVQWEQFKEALYSDSKAIWCVRGGYGCMRLIPLLKKLRPPKRPKLILGFSDITALHLYFNQAWKWPTLHSSNISAMRVADKKRKDRKVLRDLLFGDLKAPLTYKNLRPLNEAARTEGTIRGKIIGGNLRIIQTSLGTDWEVNPKGKILFAEDVGERGYSVHRMFEQMIQARLLERGVKAVVLGQFTEGEEKNGSDLTAEAFRRFAESVSYPVFSGLESGHGELNFPVPLNTPSELTLGKRGSLSISF